MVISEIIMAALTEILSWGIQLINFHRGVNADVDMGSTF